ncbi:TraB/GumN family protein [Desulfobulbus rhabdoformis]|uniref:TraB/GumN family protein n=1 Tax=Desulfobulbus rhabdoformis TaxID=34032 RepID=UPI0019659F8E|nr:TraB/GumN family protein [Desulfobulbus rhabdoformis]MBM9615806.1 TraB/GumN family protein [Desulfobulbus rhabdoformis]
MSQILFPQQHYPEDVAVLQQEDKTILLVGTAHISQQSTDLVKQVIEQEQPDVVCIELDEKRFTALSKPQAWENLDLKQVIKSKQLTTLLVNLILSTYQKKLGGQLGIMPGTELLTAAQCAEHRGIPIALCDRDVRITLRRAWRATSLWKKGYLLATLIASLFDRTELTEEKLQEMRSKDVLSELIKEMADALPQTKAVLIDERDIYMAEKIKETKGSRVVAVVGAGHMEGIRQVLSQDNQHRMEEIANLPPASSMGKIIGWGIPALILLTLFGIGLRHGMEEFGANALYWILANAVPTAVGAAVALGHPLTVLAGFAGSPLTSLTPLVGAGYVCAFVQVMAKPPVVKEFEQVSNAITTVKGWWQNKLLRIFLVFMLTTLGSAVGTWVGGYKLVSSLAQ